VSFDTLPSVIGHIRVNRLRPLAILGPKRVVALPDVPTIGEAGYPSAEGVTWFGLYGPGGMQPAQVNRLFNETVKVMQLPDVAARFKDFGATETTSASPDEFSKMVVREIEIYSRVIKQAGITLQQ
jgi:tripartite-type tricarboxylate transporter receptor subunit TctC